MLRKKVIISELLEADIDSDIVNADYYRHVIQFDTDRKLQTTSGLFTIKKNSLILPYFDTLGYRTMLLITLDKIYTVDVDAGLFVYEDWLDMPEDCWPTISEDTSQVHRRIMQEARDNRCLMYSYYAEWQALVYQTENKLKEYYLECLENEADGVDAAFNINEMLKELKEYINNNLL